MDVELGGPQLKRSQCTGLKQSADNADYAFRQGLHVYRRPPQQMPTREAASTSSNSKLIWYGSHTFVRRDVPDQSHRRLCVLDLAQGADGSIHAFIEHGFSQSAAPTIHFTLAVVQGIIDNTFTAVSPL